MCSLNSTYSSTHSTSTCTYDDLLLDPRPRHFLDLCVLDLYGLDLCTYLASTYDSSTSTYSLTSTSSSTFSTSTCPYDDLLLDLHVLLVVLLDLLDPRPRHFLDLYVLDLYGLDLYTYSASTYDSSTSMYS